jgi:putative ABC transport system permease protein
MPPLFQRLVSRLRAVWRRNGVADEIAEEMQFHLEMRIDELEQRGLSPAEARRAASRRFGNVAVLRDRGYDIRGGGFLETVATDIRFAWYLLQRRRIYSIAAILTLALGIGLTSALVSIVDATWLRPLPFPEPDRLMRVRLTVEDPVRRSEISDPSLADVRALRASTVLEQIGQRTTWEERLVLDDGQPERTKVLTMSEGYADVFGVAPVAGRAFVESDARQGAPPVAILGHAFWQRRFAADLSVIGRTILVGNVSRTVVGVLPPVVHRDTHIWIPDARPAETQHRDGGAETYARLRTGVTLQEAERALSAAARGWPVAPKAPGVTGVTLTPVYDEAIESTREGVTLIAVAVLLLVLLVSVNVAGLIFADGVERRREFAVRASMGAGHRRLVRQLLTEAAVMGAIASVLGIGVAWWSLDSLVAVLPIDFPPHASAGMNARVLVITVTAAVVTIIAITLWPAWQLTRSPLIEIMSGAAQQRPTPWPRALGRGLIAVEVALAVVLLTGGGLLIRSLDRLLSVDLGFRPEAIQTLEVTPLDPSPAVWAQYFPAALTALRGVPGVAAAGAIDGMPLGNNGLIVMAASPEGGGAMDDVTLAGVTPGYLEAMGVAVIAGRTFTEQDRGGNVVVIDATLARRLFPDGGAVGKTVELETPMTVIGVVSSVRDTPRTGNTTIYTWLTPHSFLPPTIVLRSVDGKPLSQEMLRAAVQSVGTRVLVERIRPGTDLLNDTVANSRHRTVLLSLLAGLGLLLTLIGTAGVTAYAVARRTQEVGIRIAFGATPGNVVRSMTAEALKPILFGLAAGSACAYFASTALTRFLFQTAARDPGTMVTVAATLFVSTLLAAWLPARRAARVDPVAAIREH